MIVRRLGRRGVAFLDYFVDGPIARDPENCMDMVHYRTHVARVIEGEIIGAFNGAGGGDRAARQRDGLPAPNGSGEDGAFLTGR